LLNSCSVTPHNHNPQPPNSPTSKKELEPLVRQGSVSDPAGFGLTASVAESGSQQYAVSSSTFKGQIQIYDRDGVFQRAIGKSGGGPGEFTRELLLAFDDRDSLHVIEHFGTRYSVFDPDLSHVRSVQLNSRVQAFCLEPTAPLLVIAPIEIGATYSFIQVFSRAGESVQSFGAFPQDSLDPRTMPQLAACDVEGGRWTAATPAYLIEKWSPNGERERQLRAQRPWFPPAQLARGGGPEEEAAADPAANRPATYLAGLTVDDRGRLWVFASVADSQWQPSPAGTEPDPRRSTDTVIEVIDPVARVLIAQERFDEALKPLARDHAFSIFEESTGDRRIQIWRLVLRNR
jgi:hypothetical protein